MLENNPLEGKGREKSKLREIREFITLNRTLQLIVAIYATYRSVGLISAGISYVINFGKGFLEKYNEKKK